MPLPIVDGPERAVEYAATRARIRALLQDVSEDQANTIVPSCPDWTVRGLTAHLAGVCRDLVEKNYPTGDVQAWVDRQVEERATRSVASLLDEFDEFGPGFEELIVKRPEARGALLYDIVAHEHDAACALGLAADRTSAGVRLSVDIMAPMIEADLATAGLPAVSLSDGTRTWQVGDGEPGFAVRAPSIYELMRFLGSRRSLAQMRTFDVTGDLDRFLPGLCHLPLPERDLLE
jgi:uncharacterized protein (TIGR03083 family)